MSRKCENMNKELVDSMRTMLSDCKEDRDEYQERQLLIIENIQSQIKILIKNQQHQTNKTTRTFRLISDCLKGVD